MHKNIAIKSLSLAHIFIITLSNILVQYPIEIMGFRSTWGAFSFPVIFILSDLTTRLSDAQTARYIIFRSMIPALIISYSIAAYLETTGHFQIKDIFHIHLLPLRIALASFVAYVAGQLMDIYIFQKVRQNRFWALAPLTSSTAGNLLDTFLFFFIAFYHCDNPFLSQHWMEMAAVDSVCKTVFCILALVPAYGLILNVIMGRKFLTLQS